MYSLKAGHDYRLINRRNVLSALDGVADFPDGAIAAEISTPSGRKPP